MAKGFFVPSQVSNNFVQNRRNAEGDYVYDSAANEIGLSQQVALQSLNKQYSSTINNAYSNFLMANRGVTGSTMGQGYKDAYLQRNQQNLDSSIAEANMSAANARAQLGAEGASALGQLNEQMNTEISNMNRVSSSLQGYASYLSELQRDNEYYLAEDQRKLAKLGDIDNMYDLLLERSSPVDYLDASGNLGLSYVQWVTQNAKDTETDRIWNQWLFAGGLDQFKQATKLGVKPT